MGLANRPRVLVFPGGLPIRLDGRTIGGLGVREGLLAFFFHPLGVPTGRSVAIGLLWYGMTLLVSLIGAPAFAVGHKRPEDAAPTAPDAS